MIGSCDRKSDAAKMADMKHCRKIEFGSTVITEPNKIERIISAMRRMTHYSEDYVTQILFSASMKATDRWGRTVTVDYAIGNVAVFFRKGKSRELYTLLKEYGMIKPAKQPSSPCPPPYHPWPIKESDSDAAKMAAMKDCRKIEFVFDGDDSDVPVIDDPNKIDRIISAMRQVRYFESIQLAALFSFAMRAIDSEGKTVSVDCAVGDGFVVFRDGESKKLYTLLNEYGVMRPPEKPVPGPPPDILLWRVKRNPEPNEIN